MDVGRPETPTTSSRGKQLVAGFRAIGLKKGDCVCFHSFNGIFYPIFFLGVFAGTNPAYTPFELSHALTTAKAKYVLVQSDLLEQWYQCHQGQHLQPQWREGLKHGEQDWGSLSSEASKTTTAALLFSSGTTGLPKAAELIHYNLIAQHTLVYEYKPYPFQARRLIALPMFHAPIAHTTPSRSGTKSFILRRFELRTWFWANEKYGITDVLLVPPLIIMAINSLLKDKYSLKAVKFGLIAASAAGQATPVTHPGFGAPRGPDNAGLGDAGDELYLHHV